MCHVPPSKKVGGHVPRVPHQIAPMRQIVVMSHIACWFRSGALLKFDQFYHSCFF